MAWRRPGDKPLSEPMMVRLPTHICVTRPQWVNAVSSTFHKVSPAMSSWCLIINTQSSISLLVLLMIFHQHSIIMSHHVLQMMSHWHSMRCSSPRPINAASLIDNKQSLYILSCLCYKYLHDEKTTIDIEWEHIFTFGTWTWIHSH